MSVRSMTGYAQVRRQGAWGEITATVKSVNHRALDLHSYLPMELAKAGTRLEMELIEGRCQGEVTASVLFDPKGEHLRM